MKLEIKYIELGMTHEFLSGLSLGGTRSIHRSRIAKAIATRIKEVAEEEQELQRAHAMKQADGEPMTDANGNIRLQQPKAYREDMEKFLSETYTIGGENHKSALLTLKSIVKDYGGEVSGRDAEAFALIYEQLVEEDE